MAKSFYYLFFTLIILLSGSVFSQKKTLYDYNISYSGPKTFEIGGITVSGADFFDHNALKSISGLKVGREIEIPGKSITDAIKKLWRQQLFSDISISIEKIEGKYVYLNISVKTMPRLSKFSIKGVKKGQVDDIRESIHLIRGKVLTDDVLMETENKIRKFYIEKGYLNASINIKQEPDTNLSNHVILKITIKKNKRVKIRDIYITGNNSIKERKLLKQMKNTKRNKGLFTMFTTSKFKEKLYEEDKRAFLSKYNEEGFRDAKIVDDSIYKISKKRIEIGITVDEGNRYYFRDIRWIGNTKYKTEIPARRQLASQPAHVAGFFLFH